MHLCFLCLRRLRRRCSRCFLECLCLGIVVVLGLLVKLTPRLTCQLANLTKRCRRVCSLDLLTTLLLQPDHVRRQRAPRTLLLGTHLHIHTLRTQKQIQIRKLANFETNHSSKFKQTNHSSKQHTKPQYVLPYLFTGAFRLGLARLFARRCGGFLFLVLLLLFLLLSLGGILVGLGLTGLL